MTQTRSNRLRWIGPLAAVALLMATSVAASAAPDGDHSRSWAAHQQRDIGKKAADDRGKHPEKQRKKAQPKAPRRQAERDKAARDSQRRQAERQRQASERNRRQAQQRRAQQQKAHREKVARETQRREAERRRAAHETPPRQARKEHAARQAQRAWSRKDKAVRRTIPRHGQPARAPSKARSRLIEPQGTQRAQKTRDTERPRTERRRPAWEEQRVARDTKPAAQTRPSHLQKQRSIRQRTRSLPLDRTHDRSPRKVVPYRLPKPQRGDDGSTATVHLRRPNDDASAHHVGPTYTMYNDWCPPSYRYYLSFSNSCTLSYSLWYCCSALYTQYCAPYYRPWQGWCPWYRRWPLYIHYYLTWPSRVTYYSPSYQYEVVLYDHTDPCWATLAEAWDFLAEGNAAAAYDAFDCLSEALPNDGLPLVGYALSAALLEQPESAVAAMREAVRADPESLHYLPDDDRLGLQILDLLQHYEYEAKHTYGDVDALFMVAALRYLLHEEAAAHYAIEVGITLGDSDSSAFNLRLLIESALAEDA